jgi:hypothetical protein
VALKGMKVSFPSIPNCMLEKGSSYSHHREPILTNLIRVNKRIIHLTAKP